MPVSTASRVSPQARLWGRSGRAPTCCSGLSSKRLWSECRTLPLKLSPPAPVTPECSLMWTSQGSEVSGVWYTRNGLEEAGLPGARGPPRTGRGSGWVGCGAKRPGFWSRPRPPGLGGAGAPVSMPSVVRKCQEIAGSVIAVAFRFVSLDLVALPHLAPSGWHVTIQNLPPPGVCVCRAPGTPCLLPREIYQQLPFCLLIKVTY